jgi:uncharacterized protein YqjF (DUF2071 family)
MTTEEIERATAHRPWPLADGPWIMFQSWREQLFAHWRVPVEQIRPLVPAQLELDAFEGSAWVGITPFRITGLRMHGLPELPFGSEFPEVNVRTYVTVNGQGGVYFFSLDAGSKLAVIAARVGYGLPYHAADTEIAIREDGWIHYCSNRDTGDADLVVRYRPQGGEPQSPERGTLDHFLTERYVLFVVRGEKVVRGDIHHRPWRLQPAQAVFEENTVALAAGIALPIEPPLLHYSAQQDALIWPPATVRGE